MPGVYYLVRFQDCLIWLYVLALSLVLHYGKKGLELQETSYRMVVATQMDDVFQYVFVHESKWPPVSFSRHVGNVLRPCDSLMRRRRKFAKEFRNFLQLFFRFWRTKTTNLIVNYDQKFYSTKEAAQPVTTDLTK